MALSDVRDKINNWLAPRWSWLVSKQDTYFGNHGEYFQGLWTHSSEIEQTDALDGDQIPDQLDNMPTDRPHDWRVLVEDAFDALPLPARLRLDVYEGMEDKGWSATLQVLYQGKLYERTKGVGLENVDEDWHEIIFE
jgi:hypothetical protein